MKLHLIISFILPFIHFTCVFSQDTIIINKGDNSGAWDELLFKKQYKNFVKQGKLDSIKNKIIRISQQKVLMIKSIIYSQTGTVSSFNETIPEEAINYYYNETKSNCEIRPIIGLYSEITEKDTTVFGRKAVLFKCTTWGTFVKKCINPNFDSTLFSSLKKNQRLIKFTTNVNTPSLAFTINGRPTAKKLMGENTFFYSCYLFNDHSYNINISAKHYQNFDTTVLINRKTPSIIYLPLSEDYLEISKSLKQKKNVWTNAVVTSLAVSGIFFTTAEIINTGKYKKSENTEEATRLHEIIKKQDKAGWFFLCAGVTLRLCAIPAYSKYKKYVQNNKLKIQQQKHL